MIISYVHSYFEYINLNKNIAKKSVNVKDGQNWRQTLGALKISFVICWYSKNCCIPNKVVKCVKITVLRNTDYC